MRAPCPSPPFSRSQSGATLIELMVALVVISIGLLALSQMFPAGTRGQIRDRLYTSANYYAQQKIEEVSLLSWADADLSVGRHPAGAAVESLGTRGTWTRFYQVDAMDVPLDNLRKVTVTVNWTYLGDARSATAVTYVRR